MRCCKVPNPPHVVVPVGLKYMICLLPLHPWTSEGRYDGSIRAVYLHDQPDTAWYVLVNQKVRDQMINQFRQPKRDWSAHDTRNHNGLDSAIHTPAYAYAAPLGLFKFY